MLVLLTRLLIIASIISSIYFCFWGTTTSIWLDEAFSVMMASHGFKGTIALSPADVHPPLYYFLLAVWTKIFGVSEIAIRSLSGLFYLSAILCIYLIGKTIYGKNTALLCSFLYLISPVAILHAQSARSYSLLGLLVILSFLLYLNLLIANRNSTTNYVLYIIVNIAGTFTHYLFFFVLFSQIIISFLVAPKNRLRRFMTAALLSFMPFLLLWTPVFLAQLSNEGVSWISRPDLKTISRTFRVLIPHTYAYYAILLIVLFRTGLPKKTFHYFTEFKEFMAQKQNLAPLLFFIITLSSLLIVSWFKPIYVPPRGGIILLPSFVLFIGSLLNRFGNKFLIKVFCCGMLIIAILVLWPKNSGFDEKYSDKATSKYLITHANDNDVIIYTGLNRLAIDYYLDLLKPSKPFVRITFPSEFDSHPGYLDFDSMLKRKNVFEDESHQVISGLGKIMKSDKNIWLIRSQEYTDPINNILIDKLNKNYSLREKLDLRGPFHREVLRYQKQSN